MPEDTAEGLKDAIRVNHNQLRGHIDKVVRSSVEETLNALLQAEASHETNCFGFPSNHWRQVRTNNPLERINREICRRTRAVGAVPDGHSALMLVAARDYDTSPIADQGDCIIEGGLPPAVG